MRSHQNYVIKIKNLIQTFHRNQNFISNAQLKWELLKYEIQKFIINYSKKLAKERKQNKILLENKLKTLEGDLITEDNIHSYNTYKKDFILYMIISQKILGFDQNTTGMNTAKSSQSSF